MVPCRYYVVLLEGTTTNTNIMMPRSSITLLMGTETGWLQYKDHQP
jgi:hypothetical protein